MTQFLPVRRIYGSTFFIKFSRVVLVGLCIASFVFFFSNEAFAQAKSETGLPLPRFVSLKAKRVNMRVGPGRDYEVQWLYLRKGLPVEIFQEFGNWRKVRDPNGNEGWVLHSLLSGKRAIIITPWDMRKTEKTEASAVLPFVDMYTRPSTSAEISARIEAGALASVDQCSDNWCKLDVIDEKQKKLTGYVQKTSLWGVYPNEILEN